MLTRRTVATLLSLATTLGAQTHERDPLIRGQEAAFRFSGVPPTSIGVLMISAQAGQGPCVPPPFAFCFEILEPIVLGPQMPSDFLGNASFSVLVSPTTTLFPIATQGLWLDFTTPVPSTVATNAVDGSVSSLAYYDEVFDGDNIRPDWRFLNGTMFTHGLDGAGNLVLQPTVSGSAGSWNDDVEGGMLFRPIRGDFTVTIRARSVSPTNATNPPAPDRRLGGLIVRDPASAPGQRDWIAVGIGSATAATPHAVTAIDTFGSTSTFSDTSQATQPNPLEAELRIRRQGNTVHCEYRNIPTLPFATAAIVNRITLPPVLQVGMFVSALDTPPNVETAISEIRWQN